MGLNKLRLEEAILENSTDAGNALEIGKAEVGHTFQKADAGKKKSFY
ncbi:hypothetical protein [Peribacillus muralis]|nr:hypothetical protein [Peribacillus muralis]